MCIGKEIHLNAGIKVVAGDEGVFACWPDARLAVAVAQHGRCAQPEFRNTSLWVDKDTLSGLLLMNSDQGEQRREVQRRGKAGQVLGCTARAAQHDITLLVNGQQERRVSASLHHTQNRRTIVVAWQHCCPPCSELG